MATDDNHTDLEEIKRCKGMTIVHLNIRSLLPKFVLFNEDFLDGKLDIIMVSETWMQKGLPNNLICASGYNIIRKDRQTNKRGGGLCIYLKSSIVYEELQPIPCNSDKDLEWLSLRATVGGNKKQILLLVYRPPSGNTQEALDKLRMCLEYFQTNHRNSEITIMGDLNIDYGNNGCSYVKSLKLLETLFGMNQLIHSATRSTAQTRTILDLCFTTISNLNFSGVINCTMSDHNPIFLVKKKIKLENKARTFRGRCYKNYNLDLLKLELNKVNWEEIKLESNPDIQWNLMHTHLVQIADKLCPKKMFYITKQRPAFLTTELLELIKERDTVFRLARKHNDMDYWQRANSLRKQTETAVLQSRKEYVIDKLKTNQNDSKKFWQSVKLVLPDNRSSTINVVWDPEKNELVNGLYAANLINNFFCNIGRDLSSRIGQSDMEFLPTQTDCLFEWGRLISIRDVQE